LLVKNFVFSFCIATFFGSFKRFEILLTGNGAINLISNLYFTPHFGNKTGYDSATVPALSQSDKDVFIRTANSVLAKDEADALDILRKNAGVLDLLEKGLINDDDILDVAQTGKDACNFLCRLLDLVNVKQIIENNADLFYSFAECAEFLPMEIILNTLNDETKLQKIDYLAARIKNPTVICLANFNYTDEQIDKLEALQDDEYYIELVIPQNDAEHYIEAQKTEPVEFLKEEREGIERVSVEIIHTFYPDGSSTSSKVEKAKNDKDEYLTGFSKNHLSEHYQYFSKNELINDIELIFSEDGPEYIILAKASAILDGAFETCRYNLKCYPENVDIFEAIRKGTIDDIFSGEKIAEVRQNPDGSVVLNEAFEYKGNKIKRKYIQKTDENGNILKSEYAYRIYNQDNNLFNLERSFIKNPDGTTTTIINGKKYVTEFDDLSGIYTVKDDSGETLCKSNLMEKLTKPDANNSKKEIKDFMNFAKNIPADGLLLLDEHITKITIMPNGSHQSSIWCDEGLLNVECSLPALMHELGHIEAFKEEEYLFEDEELIEIYNEEMIDFRKKYPDMMNNVIHYFSQTGGDETSGLDEFIAETMMLITTYGNSGDLSARAHYLVRYFPKTIAYIANELGYNKF